MKKLLSIIGIALVTLGLAGCGNSPDGDKQKISNSSLSLEL